MAFRFKAPKPTKYGKRHVPGKMNQTESQYADMLEARKRAGEVQTWEFEAVTFRIGEDRCAFTPDFKVLLADGSIEFIDVKGGGPIDAKSAVKIKVAAEKFPEFQFVTEQKLPKKLGGSWKRTEF